MGKRATEHHPKEQASKATEHGARTDAPELLTQLQRLQAEFENYKKRVEKERGELSTLANGALVRKLLPVLDNFELALGNVPEGGRAGGRASVYKGMELIYAQLVETLEAEGLAAIAPAAGAKFDPYRHEAMLAEAQEGAEKNTVLEVLQKGYALKDRVLRTAKVKVAK